MTLDSLHDSQQATLIIDRAFNGQRNVLTPNRRGCFLSRYYAIELSEGDSIANCHTGNGGLWGVTVVSRETKESRHDLSQAFDSRAKAEAYILQLKNLKD